MRNLLFFYSFKSLPDCQLRSAPEGRISFDSSFKFLGPCWSGENWAARKTKTSLDNVCILANDDKHLMRNIWPLGPPKWLAFSVNCKVLDELSKPSECKVVEWSIVQSAGTFFKTI